jgi:dTDP-4-amino-4,6-dideoxygalactose transaminase
MNNKLYVGRPNIGNRERFLERVNGILDRRWLSNDGPLLKEFEEKVAAFLGVKNVVAMCNATAAIEIACRALDLKGEVIVPSYTFVATAHALQWQEITPVFCDMNPATHNIDPAKIERLITPRTTGIIGVHVWGRGCETEAIEEIAARRNLKVMYDASHGFGCTKGGRMLGTFGECEVFSFHATKFLNCFEGGAVVTNNDDLAEKMRLMRNFGFVDFDKVVYLGVNGKMSEIHAAMGLTNLEAIGGNHLGEPTQLRGVSGRVGGCSGDFRDRLQSRRAEQLSICGDRGGPGSLPAKPRRDCRSAPRRKHHCQKILLARLPQDGALPLPAT